ncbi:alpha-mannosidase 2x [Lingula anatina]|uniref:Alpha-mannosidase n=1 Tax=Lingula anatina TaxID=7574 RepID=A0A1S3IQZ5_LINAN|nr:alpha-mannosidase 2x [Lingula anatina]|eukprot:XP_013400341.1 alpha-mannosidase 2x [Lingula anatina]
MIEKIEHIEAAVKSRHKTVDGIQDVLYKVARDDPNLAQALERLLMDSDDTVDSEEDRTSSLQEVLLPTSMCKLTDRPTPTVDFNVQDVFENGLRQKHVTTKSEKDYSTLPLKIFVVPFSHNDPGWLRTYDDYLVNLTSHILDNMVEKMDIYKDMTFIYAELSFFAPWFERISPEKQAKVKQYVKEGRLEIVTGGWVMTDEASAHYFSMIDQMIEGHQWLENQLGIKPQSGWSIDPFGYSSTMAYLLKRMDFKSMLLQRVDAKIKAVQKQRKTLEFMWRQLWDPRGETDMFCHVMPGGHYDVINTCGVNGHTCCLFDFKRQKGVLSCSGQFAGMIDDSNVEMKSQILLEQYRKKASLYKSNVLLVPLGDDFRYLKAEEWDLQYTNYQRLFQYMNSRPGWNVQARFGTLTDYFNALYERVEVQPGSTVPGFPVLSGDFFPYSDLGQSYWTGYFTSRPFYKYINRLLQTKLRGSEILFTMAQTASKQNHHEQFPARTLMRYLVNARRTLGLFQHHDAITGTSKDHVVRDYGKLLSKALSEVNTVTEEAAHVLMTKDKTLYKYNISGKFFETHEYMKRFDSIPEQRVINLRLRPRQVVLYNSLAHQMVQVVRVLIDVPHVEVKSPGGNIIASQVSPHWVNDGDQPSSAIYQLAFVASVPALGMSTYAIRQVEAKENSRNSYASIVIYNSNSGAQLPQPEGSFIFPILKRRAEEFAIENSRVKLKFEATGLLKLVTEKASCESTAVKLEFVNYKSSGGAYLFLPMGEASLIEPGEPYIRAIHGHIVSEVHVFLPHVRHMVRINAVSGTDGGAFEIENIVDMTQKSMDDRELVMRFRTDIDSSGVFYTDLNGFQFTRRKTLINKPIQANYYPITTMVYMENEQKRFNLLSAQPHGTASMGHGWLEVMLDRRLLRDDHRGLEQGMTDNVPTLSRFRVLIEPRTAGVSDQSSPVGYPSLASHLLSLAHTNPFHVLPRRETVDPETELSPHYSPLLHDLPCELHLLNFRTLQGVTNDWRPKDSAALLIHRVGIDCSFPTTGLQCKAMNGKIPLGRLFKNIPFKKIMPSSLSLMYDKEAIDNNEIIQVEPLEINAFKMVL